MDMRDQKPRARTEGLLVEDVDGETLVYDLGSHEAHRLNPAAALVWRMSDGRATVRELVSRLDEAGLPRDEAVVWMALTRLDAVGLLEPMDLPGSRFAFSRKEVLRVLGAAAAMTLLLPAVDSVVAPLAAQAASCVTPAQCNQQQPPCSGLPLCNQPTRRCAPQGATKCGGR